MSPWIWITVIVAVWLAVGLFGLAMCKAATDADEQALRLMADHCPDEVEP